MKHYSPWLLAILLLTATGSNALAEEKAESESSQLAIEKIVEDCEKQYNEQNYPDPDERNNLIDQCIDEKAANIPGQQ